MTVMDKYVERFREGMDDEFQLDVMYRAYVIFAGVVANVSIACAAILAWVLPPNYVLMSYIMGAPVYVGQIVVSWYTHKRVIRPRINLWGYSRLLLVLSIIWAIVLFSGVLMRYPNYADSPVAVLITGGIVGGVAGVAGLWLLNKRGREFYWECQRRTDLIRFGKFISGDYVWPWKAGVKEGKASDAYRQLYPIPADDIQANPENLRQNPNY